MIEGVARPGFSDIYIETIVGTSCPGSASDVRMRCAKTMSKEHQAELQKYLKNPVALCCPASCLISGTKRLSLNSVVYIHNRCSCTILLPAERLFQQYFEFRYSLGSVGRAPNQPRRK